MSAAAASEGPSSAVLELLEIELANGSGDRSSRAALSPSHWEACLGAPLREFLRRPGKELRARLLEVSWTLAGGSRRPPAALPCIVELLHGGSLIIDDIEDGSARRRGAPALHVLYGVPVALNAGNWLYFWALCLIERLGLAPEVELRAHRAVNRAVFDCHRGQAVDLGLRTSELSRDEIGRAVENVATLKTGSLLGLAADLGALAAGAPPDRAAELSRFGREVGVALQMLDDVSGLFDGRRAHKGHEDLLLGRPTWPWAWVARTATDATYTELRCLAREVETGRTPPGGLADLLRRLLGASPRRPIHRRVNRAFARLERRLGPSSALSGLRAELAQVESSYG